MEAAPGRTWPPSPTRTAITAPPLTASAGRWKSSPAPSSGATGNSSARLCSLGLKYGGVRLKLAVIDWTAVGSIATAGTGIIALVAIFPAVLIYRGQNRAASITAIRTLTETVLRDSKQIYELTLDSVVAISGAQIQAFRNQLGQSATADTFRKYFYKETGSVLGSAFLEGSLVSPAYGRLSQLWVEIDQASARFRGVLRILFYAAGIIGGNSRAACYPFFSYSLADDMRRDPDVRASYQDTKDLDELTLAVAADLARVRLFKGRVVSGVFGHAARPRSGMLAGS